MYRRPANHRSHFESSEKERYLAYTDESFAREQRATHCAPVILTTPFSVSIPQAAFESVAR
jgi:hypothetical protein